METESARLVLEELLVYVDGELKSKTGELLERAERTLSSSWQAINDPEQQSAVFATARWLKDNKSSIHGALYRRLLRALTEPVTSDPDVSDELVVMDDGTMNVIVIRARMVHKVLDRARSEIKALEVRLSLLSNAGSTINIKALDPGHIADGYLTVLQDLGVPDEARSLLMEIYGDRSVELLVQFYEGINRLLIKLGVLPNLQVVGQVAGRTADSSFTLVGGRLSSILDADFASLQLKLEQLPLNEWHHGVLGALVIFPPTMVMTSMHEASIDKVESFFVDLLHDERISLRARSELVRLAATLLAIMLDDETQLDNPKGPINVFIKQLSLLGTRDKESHIEDFERITAMVGRIVSERGTNIDSFRSGSQVLYTIARGEVERILAQRMDISAGDVA